MQKEKFIKYFINRRKELGYSQSKIANEIGISDQAVSNWERGVSFPDLIYLDDIAKLLKTNVDSLITGKNIELNIKPEVKFDAERFSQYILKLRKNKRMTQKDLGKILEIPGQNISKFENGVFLPSLEVLEKYAEIFNVSFLNLYYGLDDEELFLETQKQYNHNKLKWLIIPVVIILVSLVLIIPSLITKKHIVTIILNEDTVLTYRIKDNENIELPIIPTKKGYDVSWSDTDTLITEDKVFKVIYTPKTYTITYKFENSEIEDYKQTVTYGESFKLYIPDNDNFKGYIYQDKEFNETIYGYDYDITLIGKFNKQYKVTIILDENNSEVKYVEENTNITLPSLPTKKGYDTSWSDTDTLITEYKVFKVIYTPKTYTITYKFENSEIEDYKQTVTYGESFKLYIPDNDNFKGYIYQNKEFTETVYEYDYDITLIGKFDKQYKVTIILDENNSEVRYVEEGTNITLPSLPTKKGYNTSWSDLDTLITEDKVYKVVYTPKTYTITYTFESDGIEDYKQTVTYGESFKLYIPDNDNFKGYIYQNKEFTESVYNYAYNITLIGKFDKQYKVTIILDENNSEVRYVEEGINITLPSLPTKKGYNTSWSDLDTLITEDKVYKVVYTPKTYTITYTFESDGIEDYKQTVTYGESFKLYIPDNDNLKGYIYQDKEFTESVYNYAYNITLIGKFDKQYKVTIILDENNSEVRYVEEGTNITLPSLPTKKGYDVSWSDTDTLITEDKVFKVIYTPKTYTITYKFKNTKIEDYKQTVTYGEKYSLKMPNINEENFMGYTYNGEIITDGIYEYDHDITLYGEFSDESYTIYREYTYTKKHDSVGYGCSFVLDEVDIDLYLSECPYSPGEYENYKIIAWKDQKGNIYEIGNTYIYNYKEDIVLCPVFAYYGDAFKVTINNDEAKIIEYNIDRIIELIIPDYIIIDNNEYKVTEIAEGTFQDTYFRNITISSNITKISKNTFRYDDSDGYAPNGGNIYYCGTLYEWFNIDFEEYITSNKAKINMKLYISEFLVGKTNRSHNILAIPEGVEVIKSYSLANCNVFQVVIPNSVHTIEKYAFMYSYININQIINLENVENVHQNAFEK